MSSPLETGDGGAAMPPEIDTTKPHPARMWDYYLGGKDHFAADRAVAEQVVSAWPAIRVSARENRAFIGRAVHHLTAEAGITQFLDIGSGLPTANNVHEIAQRVNPAARVVYVDNDPIVLAHGRALLTSSPEGRSVFVHADLRQPEKIIGDPVVRETLDFGKPIALILAAVVHFLVPEDQPARIIKTLVDALPSGSYVVASHGSTEYGTPEEAERVTSILQAGGVRVAARDSFEFTDLVFSGLELLPPGIVLLPEWRPDPDGGPRASAREVGTNAAVGRKP